MTIRLTAAFAATLVFSPVSQAANLTWSHHPQPSLSACKTNADRGARSYGVTDLVPSGDNLTGLLDPDFVISLICLPAPTGATLVIHVASDQSVSFDTNEAVRVNLHKTIVGK